MNPFAAFETTATRRFGTKAFDELYRQGSSYHTVLVSHSAQLIVIVGGFEGC